MPSHVACVSLNNNFEFTPRLGRTKGKLICIPNGNTHRWWHDSKLSTQLSVIVLATVYCELSCNVYHICYLMQTQTFSNLRFQPMCRALRPVSNFDYNIQQGALAANLHSWLVAKVVCLWQIEPDSSYDELDSCWKIRNSNHQYKISYEGKAKIIVLNAST